jgi:hypothetical protein
MPKKNYLRLVTSRNIRTISFDTNEYYRQKLYMQPKHTLDI